MAENDLWHFMGFRLDLVVASGDSQPEGTLAVIGEIFLGTSDGVIV